MEEGGRIYIGEGEWLEKGDRREGGRRMFEEKEFIWGGRMVMGG